MVRPIPLPTVGFQSDGQGHCYFELLIMAGIGTVQNSLSTPDAFRSQWAGGRKGEITKARQVEKAVAQSPSTVGPH